MKNSNDCGVVRDLLPLVIDNVASDESKKLVEAHLAECSECDSVMQNMRADINNAVISDKDERFVKLCIKLRKALSLKRALMFLMIFVVASGSLACGIAFAYYKMYDEWRAFTPEQCEVGVNNNGLLVFEYEPDARHEHLGYRFSFEKDTGVYYITPNISAWPLIFSKAQPVNTDVFSSIRLKNGELVYVDSYITDERVFDEFSGRYHFKEELSLTVITELRVGTPENYLVVYRAGDELPVIDMDW